MRIVAKAITIIFRLTAFPGWSQPQEESAAKAAEQAGKLREALNYYVAALQKVSESSADDQRLREAIIKVAQRLSPPPAVPDEARRFFIRGQIAIKEAKSPLDLDEAAKEFGKALRVAPWWADSYFNQGVVLEKAGKFNEAIRSLRFYLLAAPNNPDTQKVKDQIFALEYRQEKTQKEAATRREADDEATRRAERARQEQAAVAQGLAGLWVNTSMNPTILRYAVSVNGDSIEIEYVDFNDSGRGWRKLDTPGVEIYRGKIDGLRISGTSTYNATLRYPNGSVFTRPLTGTISRDGQRIHLDYIAVHPAGAEQPNRPEKRGDMVRRWMDDKRTMVLERQ